MTSATASTSNAAAVPWFATDSRAALGFYLFKTELRNVAGAPEPPPSLTDEQVREALSKAEARLAAEFRPDATYGTLFRVGRESSERT